MSEKNQYICWGSENISPLSDISSLLPFLKILRAMAQVKLINF